jgi:aspartate racemase
MGPLASAAFIDTLYRLNMDGPTEQTSPVCLLLSDPTFPDRTEAILKGDTACLLTQLVDTLTRLQAMVDGPIIMACVTLHHLLPEVPAAQRRRVLSLLDLVIDEIEREPRPLVLLTTTGTRAARIFESHERWGTVEHWVHYLDATDQEDLHVWLYRLKTNRPDLNECLAWLARLGEKYGHRGWIFGCTELHMLHKILAQNATPTPGIVDPLWIVARDLPQLLAERSAEQRVEAAEKRAEAAEGELARLPAELRKPA